MSASSAPTARTHRFPAGPSAPELDLRCPSGSVAVDATEGADEVLVTVQALDSSAASLLDRVVVEWSGSRLSVTVPERRLTRSLPFAIRVGVPAGAGVRATVASADVRLRGPLGQVVVTGASGRVDVEHCASLQARSASGDTRVGTVERDATLGSASADVRLGSVGGALQVRTASGAVVVDDVTGDVSAATASGAITVGRASSGTVRLRTVSGDADVSVVPGLRLWLDLRSVSGRLHSELDEDDPGTAGGGTQLSVLLQSVSGDLHVRRAAPRPA